MPEYLAPGVYVEEVSFRNKSIEGVSTTTTGFIGPARYGPITLEPDILTSLGEFERVYGDRQQLDFDDEGQIHNFAWHAVRAFFEEGGKRLYFQRVFRSRLPALQDLQAGRYPSPEFSTAQDPAPVAGLYLDGHGRVSVPTDGGAGALQIRARYPGAAGNMRVRLTLRLSQNILGGKPFKIKANGDLETPTVNGLLENDVVWINDVNSPIDSPPGPGGLYVAHAHYDAVYKINTWQFTSATAPARELNVMTPDPNPQNTDNVRIVTMTVSVTDRQGATHVWDNLPLDPAHIRAGSPDSVAAYFSQKPANLDLARTLPIVIEYSVDSGVDVVTALLANNADLLTNLGNFKSSDALRSVDVELSGGNDGSLPSASEYEGLDEEDQRIKTGLKVFEDIEDISIVAAPGSTFGYEANDGRRSDAATIISLLISHAERMRYRIAVIDSGDEQSVAQVRAMRSRYDSKYAALYYPWVRVLDPVTRQEINLPPSGFITGIYSRNDINRAVYKAPANEVINLALGFEQMLNMGKQEVLNPEGINCLRFFEGRGMLVWGARLMSSDPEWKYVNLRRYFAFLERSLDRGTQWSVFEPNGDALWANVRRTIEDFLLNQWQSGALLGDKPDKAFFVKCDRTTMTQNDLDNGRLVCLIGIAPLYPAEFVIFRIGQWTADRKV